MNYAIDITRPRTKLAMLALGIEPEELIIKNLEDFSGRNINEDVQQLRYNYYTRKLKEVIRQLNSYIREEAMRKLQSTENSPKSPQQFFLTQTLPQEEIVDEIAEIKEKEKNKILDSFNDVNNAISTSIAIEKRLQMRKEAKARVQSELITKRMKLKKYKEMQLENIKRIKREEESKAKGYKNEGFVSYHQKFSSADITYQPYAKTLTEFNESDEDIASKINEFDERMKRSQRNYEKNIQQKREAVSKLLEKNVNHVTVDKSTEFDIKRIFQMVEKQKQVEARRHSFVVEQQEYRQEMRKKHEKRRSIALERIKEEEKLETLRTEAIERRMEISARILKQKHESWLKELELKNELSKLKDEEALLNAERKKRIM